MIRHNFFLIKKSKLFCRKAITGKEVRESQPAPEMGAREHHGGRRNPGCHILTAVPKGLKQVHLIQIFGGNILCSLNE